MPTKHYTASKTRSQGRSAWAITFRHPLRTDPRTEQGLKVRRGLGTSDEVEADKLVAQMNELLADESFYRVSMRSEAARQFSSVIVDAFYDGIENPPLDPWKLREEHLPLPTKEDGYSKVLLVGTTGAGKTSLLRHLIGTDPQKDRFPSTSTAKTTTSDIEIITSDESYQAVVTFFSEWAVRTSVRECVADACLAAWDKLSDEKLITRLLNHQDQKFRLSYILGSWQKIDSIDDDDDDDNWEDEEDSSINDSEVVDASDTAIPTLDERVKMQKILEEYVQRIRKMTEDTIQNINKILEVDIISYGGKDREVVEELFDEEIQALDAFDELVNDIMEEIQQRFELLTIGNLIKRRTGWPEVWTYEIEDREAFISQIKKFSSNYARSFGRLLTPLVQGIRVKGAFDPIFTDEKRSLILMDGQGLGHTPDSSASVTTHITSRFEAVDVILLVDNSQQPMQAAPLSVIRAIATSGYQHKLAIAFTHFDNVKGDNLPKFEDKKAHVMASITNGLTSLRDILGQPIIRAIERNLEQRCFMMGGLDKSLEEVKKRRTNRIELERLLQFCEDAIKPQVLPEVAPIYDPTGLLFAFQQATRDFHKRWDAILGLGELDGVYKEHWTRVRALNRRISEETDVEYDTLKPVADLLARLNESISKFLDNPSKWTMKNKSEEEAEQAVNNIRQKVFAELHSFTTNRLVKEPLAVWVTAYKHSGKGSTMLRARDIKVIYDTAAPELTPIMNIGSQEFLQQIRQLVHNAIEQTGGKLEASVVAKV
ncbi:MAG: hypothetical protein HWQ35_11230 [Nostoc sp. NMS1]|uniref:hypothetical protein n=1 Tax=unclassified Nostoc TaxID=2593658 RepID=UPI0025D26EF7|nr:MULTISPECIES: hypothetical protein [unclassified Nostoc]MBN3907101.1 hypothetical protein [Nostoc sp. NMS1]MBN3993013.1 hypothetical protein [Nostoc sp. NMS2]